MVRPIIRLLFVVFLMNLFVPINCNLLKEEAIIQDPVVLDSLFKMGKKLYKKQDFTNAVKELKKVARSDSNNIDVLYLAGCAYHHKFVESRDSNNFNRELLLQSSQLFSRVLTIKPSFQGKSLFIKNHFPELQTATNQRNYKRAREIQDIQTIQRYDNQGVMYKIYLIWAILTERYLYFHENQDSVDWAFSEAEQAGLFSPGNTEHCTNLMKSCEENALLFINSSYEYLIIRFLQIKKSFRKDIRAINMELLNTKEYLKHIKKTIPQVPISYSIREIEEKLNHQLNPLERAVNYKMRSAGIVVTLPGRDTKRALRVQDQMLVNIVDSNRWKKPVYFPITVQQVDFMGLGPYLSMEGLVYKLTKDTLNRISVSKMKDNLLNVYSYKDMCESNPKTSQYIRGNYSNYFSAFIQLILQYKENKNFCEAKMAYDAFNNAFPEGTINKSSSRRESFKQMMQKIEAKCLQEKNN